MGNGKVEHYFFFKGMFHLFLWGGGQPAKQICERPISGTLPFVPDLLGQSPLLEVAGGSVGGLLCLPPPAHRESVLTGMTERCQRGGGGLR